KLITALELDNKQLADAANFTNEYYPNIEMNFDVVDPDKVTAGSPSYINVVITRDIEDDDEPKTEVHAPFYPAEKTENWWLVVGDQKSNSLLAIKRVTVGKQANAKLDYTVPEPGDHELTLFLMSDCYNGVDQAPTFTITAAEGMEE